MYTLEKLISNEIYSKPLRIATSSLTDLNKTKLILKKNLRDKFIFLGTDKSKADFLKIKMRINGFKGAFVVAFYKDKRISMKEALDLQNK